MLGLCHVLLVDLENVILADVLVMNVLLLLLKPLQLILNQKVSVKVLFQQLFYAFSLKVVLMDFAHLVMVSNFH